MISDVVEIVSGHGISHLKGQLQEKSQVMKICKIQHASLEWKLVSRVITLHTHYLVISLFIKYFIILLLW